MKIIGNILGLVLLALGVLWIGQYEGLIPQTFIEIPFSWDPRGPVAAGAGLFILFIVNFEGRRRR
jgi:hypothetical protein